MNPGSLTLQLTPITIPVYLMLILSVIEVARTWGVTTRPLSFAILFMSIVQLLWILGIVGLPGSAAFQDLAVWLAIIDAAIIPTSVALAYMAAGRYTIPIASALGLLALLHFLIVTGIVPVSGLM